MIRLSFITLFTLMLSACTIKPATDYRSPHDFTQYTHFALKASPEGATESIDSNRIQEAVTLLLKQKGLNKADTKDANLQVRYRIEDETEVEQSGVSAGFGLSPGKGSIALCTPPQYYERIYGKLVLEFLDPSSKSIVWRSISQRQLRETITGAERTEFIKKEITLMLNAYPPVHQ